MMTGLRPDTTISYSFFLSFRPFISFPEHFALLNYSTAGYGKIYHSDDIEDNHVGRRPIGYGISASNWYKYQAQEERSLNSTVNPDRHTPEEEYRDYQFASKAIEGMRDLHMGATGPYFFLGLGFKLPHISLHVPHKYYAMYASRNRQKAWSQASRQALSYPPTAPSTSYQCCASRAYTYMKEEGDAKSGQSILTGRNIAAATPLRMHQELMRTYAAAITFVDAQVGAVARLGRVRGHTLL
jgi:arylsulfatase A-like enzyme